MQFVGPSSLLSNLSPLRLFRTASFNLLVIDPTQYTYMSNQHHSAGSIIQKEEKALLRERIRVLSNKIKNFESEKLTAQQHLNYRDLSHDLQTNISRYLEIRCRNVLIY